MLENGEEHTVAGQHVIVKEDAQQAPIEKVEDIRPSWKEVAVAVPHFRTVQPGQGLQEIASSYTGDTYVRGFELQSGVVDEVTLRTDPRFANDPRLIVYEVNEVPGDITRYDMATHEASSLSEGAKVSTKIGWFTEDSFRLELGKDNFGLNFVEFAPIDRNQEFDTRARIPSTKHLLVRTSQPLNDQQVSQFRQQGAINQTARNFGYPQGR